MILLLNSISWHKNIFMLKFWYNEVLLKFDYVCLFSVKLLKSNSCGYFWYDDADKKFKNILKKSLQKNIICYNNEDADVAKWQTRALEGRMHIVHGSSSLPICTTWKWGCCKIYFSLKLQHPRFLYFSIKFYFLLTNVTKNVTIL